MPDWAIRVDGTAAALPDGAARRLDELGRDAERRLRGVRLSSFADVRSFPGFCLATVGIGPRHAPVRARRSGRTVGDAVLACCDAIVDRLGIPADRAATLTTRPPACEFVLRTWILPAAGAPLSEADRERACDEQFVYQLSDDEALVRAELSGEPVYFHGVKGHRAVDGLIRWDGRWLRLAEVERPAWELPMSSTRSVPVALAPAEGAGPPVELSFGKEHLLDAATLADAAAALETRSPPVMEGVIRDWGFQGFVAREAPGWIRVIGAGTDVYRIAPDTGPFGIPTWVTAPSVPVDKWRRLAGILACPKCRARLGDALGRGACPRCGATFGRDGAVMSFVDRPADQIVHDPGASRNTPSKHLVHEIRLHPSGLILNVGAGDAVLAADNLVNLELCRYPTTDVVADAGALPFADGSFDAVFSQSVLEHVPDPFACAREMQRVLQTGGTLHADAPFFAPFHGFPDHYFNMTMNGLRRLFRDLQEIDVREGPHHAPALALFEVLSRFCTMIRDEDGRRTVLGITVRELLDMLQSGTHPEIIRDLDPKRTFEISAGFSFYGMKKGPP